MRRILLFLSALVLICRGVASAANQETSAANPIVIDNYRFTFITDNLVRLEYAMDAWFVDDSTLFAVDRRVQDVDVRVERPDDRRFVFSTRAMRVEFENDGMPLRTVQPEGEIRDAGPGERLDSERHPGAQPPRRSRHAGRHKRARTTGRSGS